MSNIISNANMPWISQPSTASTDSSQAAPAESAVPAASSTGSSGSDRVQLNDSVQSVQNSISLSTAPVDSQRVQQLREAISNGSYVVNPRNIAEQLVSMNQEIPD